MATVLPRTLSLRQDLIRRCAVLVHHNLGIDSPIRTNAIPALVFLTCQVTLSYLTLRPNSPDGTLAWLIPVLLVVGNLAAFLRTSPRRGPDRREKKRFRKVLTTELIDELIDRCQANRVTRPEAEILQSRTRILNAIASNVASYFGDFSKTRTSAALLVLSPCDGEECLEIVARDDPSRSLRRIHDVEHYIAFKTIKLGLLHSTGNIAWQYPALVDKPYKSVLSLPIKLQGKTLAALNVDSTRMFHFDGRESVFETNLGPYVRLLALTFI